MRHRKGIKKLGLPTDQRIALLRSLSSALILNGKINTTFHRAKEASRYVEKIITLGKKGDVYSRRRAISLMGRKDVVFDVFNRIAPKYKDKQGGYTRITKIGIRKGDSATIATLEFV